MPTSCPLSGGSTPSGGESCGSVQGSVASCGRWGPGFKVESFGLVLKGSEFLGELHLESSLDSGNLIIHPKP